MIRHVFLWQLVDPQDADKVIDLLDQLSEKYDFILDWSRGNHAAEPNENGDPWDGALITDFATWADLELYSTDDFHHEIVGQLLPLLTQRAVVDFVVDQPSQAATA